MTQSVAPKEAQSATIIIIIGLFGISLGVGFVTMVMLALLFLVAVGGPEWGPMLMIFGSPVIGFVMGVGSLVMMGGYSWWYFRGKRPFSTSYFINWILSWLVSLAILAFPFFLSLIAVGYNWPEESFIWTIPLSLFVGLLLGSSLNWVSSKRTKAA